MLLTYVLRVLNGSSSSLALPVFGSTRVTGHLKNKMQALIAQHNILIIVFGTFNMSINDIFKCFMMGY